LHAAEAGLARIQGEQQSALARQSELGNSFQGMVARLHELEQRADARPRRSPEMPAIIAALLLLAVILAGVFIIQRQQDRSRELDVVQQDVRDIRGFMEQRIDSQDAALNKLALALKRQETDKPPAAVEATPAQATEPQAADEQPSKSETFVPDIRELQDALLTLGYDLGSAEPNGELGAKTRQALQEFRQFYLPDSEGHDELISEPLVDLILKSADVSRADAARFNIRRDVLAAIRLGSTRTGVDFSFLMELARIESNFNPVARAPRSSATGLFQFRDPGWLEAIRAFGAEYGLQDYAAQVQLIDDDAYEPGQIVRDPLQLKVLALRLNPRLSTLMMAESIKRNLRILSDRMGREPDRTDLYLAHFLGPDGALMFLERLDEDPDAIAADLFPQKAESYPGVFLNRRQQQPRTVADVYRRFERKFTTARYTSGLD
jgi:peptidoglycan hydrolase-like protein with peptidoglycan-binding domain